MMFLRFTKHAFALILGCDDKPSTVIVTAGDVKATYLADPKARIAGAPRLLK